MGDDKDRELGNARIGYQTAVSLLTYDGTLVWQKFSNLVQTHAILLGAIVLTIIESKESAGWLVRLLSASGLVLCCVWFLLMARNFANFRYWMSAARGLEQHLKPIITTLTTGQEYSDGKSVNVGGQALHMRWWQMPRAETVCYGLLAIFAVMYLGFFDHFRPAWLPRWVLWSPACAGFLGTLVQWLRTRSARGEGQQEQAGALGSEQLDPPGQERAEDTVPAGRGAGKHIAPQ